jgi:hypothetical protein
MRRGDSVIPLLTCIWSRMVWLASCNLCCFLVVGLNTRHPEFRAAQEVLEFFEVLNWSWLMVHPTLLWHDFDSLLIIGLILKCNSCLRLNKLSWGVGEECLFKNEPIRPCFYTMFVFITHLELFVIVLFLFFPFYSILVGYTMLGRTWLRIGYLSCILKKKTNVF